MIWPDGDSYVGAWENGQIQVEELVFEPMQYVYIVILEIHLRERPAM